MQNPIKVRLIRWEFDKDTPLSLKPECSNLMLKLNFKINYRTPFLGEQVY